MTAKISSATGSDIEELRQLFLSVRQATFAWLDTSAYRLTDFDEQTKDEWMLVARCDNSIAGFISVWEAEAFLHHLYVHKDHQGMGVGTALLNAVKERFAAGITLKCLVKNTAALAFYKRNCFKETTIGTANNGEFIVLGYSV